MHKKNLFQSLFSCYIVISVIFPTLVGGTLFDWFWSQSERPKNTLPNDLPQITIPFEYKTVDEKFLEEASKFTDLMKTSSLDVCQHKVILQLKTSCFSMTEEELSKMSVNLLNCQSQVDGRKIFPCSESMSLKECTKDMDAAMWNAYHLMNNRARAVCLAARRSQFHALSEMTINKLMATSQDQINKMTNLLSGQEKLESLTLGTINFIEKGQKELMEQQESLKNAQKTVQEFVTFNLEQLTNEKALIAAGNKELAKMTQSIKEKLDEANQQLISQAEVRLQSHKKLLKDIQVLQLEATKIFEHVDSSTQKLLKQHEMASLRQTNVVQNLEKINYTINYLFQIINATRREIDNKFYWIQDYLDGTGNNIGNLICITSHTAYLLIGMLFASFLNVSSTCRAVLAIVVPLNLYVTYNRGVEKAMNYLQMTILLIITTISIGIIHQLKKFISKTPLDECLVKSSKLYSSLPHSPSTKDSKNILNMTVKFFRNIWYKITNSFHRIISFVFGQMRGRSNTHQPSAPNLDENIISSSFVGNKNAYSSNWNEFTPTSERYQESVNSKVNEWLQSREYYSRSVSPSSTTRNVADAVTRDLEWPAWLLLLGTVAIINIIVFE